MKMNRYKVAGPVPFPVDMLRYDEAWPATQEASQTIGSGERGAGRIEVELCSYKAVPTPARWKSHQWEVVPTTRKR